MGIGTVSKKQVLRIKSYITVILVFLAINSIAQKDPALEKRWDNMQRSIEYGKNPKQKEPKDWWSTGPHHYDSQNTVSPEEVNESNDFKENILKSKQGEKGHGKGKSAERKMKEPEMPEPPEFDAPEIDTPDIGNVDPNKISKSTWKLILFILIFIAVIVGLYFWLRKQNANPKIEQTFDDDWNPEVITKSELESRLENALLSDNFREAVRVYFTLILQELIVLEYIEWKREKTNHDYLRELKNHAVKSQFSQSIRVFDIVWYGEYVLDKNRFGKIQPLFLSFISQLKAIKK